MRYVIELIARRIAGDIALSSDPGAALRKWREIFGVSQSEVAKTMGIAPSVLSDYEKGRRSPGVKFVKRFVEAIIRIDEARGFTTIKKLAGGALSFSRAVIDMREFSKPLSVDEVITLVEGIVLNSIADDRPIYGYTIVDSITAITTMSGHDFWYLMGLTSERALVFTNVERGRSPMIAIRVAPVKPAIVIIHGPRRSVDPLAILLADRERIPLVLSLANHVEDIAEKLRSRSFE